MLSLFVLDGVKIIHSPFTCAVLPNFLNTSEINSLEIEARKIPLIRRLNDLFSLNQSEDLKTLSKSNKLSKKFPLLSKLRLDFRDTLQLFYTLANFLSYCRDFFASDMLRWMKNVTGADLDEDEVSSTVSLYNPNGRNVLLVCSLPFQL